MTLENRSAPWPNDAPTTESFPTEFDPAAIHWMFQNMAQLTENMVAVRAAQAAPEGNGLRDDTPTLATHLPRVLETLGEGTRRTYRSPLNRLCVFAPCLPLDPDVAEPEVGASADCARLACSETHTELGDVTIDIIVADDLDRFAAHLRVQARRKERDRIRRERYAAVKPDNPQLKLSDVVVTEKDLEEKVGNSAREGAVTAMSWFFAKATGNYLKRSPAAQLTKPKRVQTPRRGINERELLQVANVGLATARDPELIELLLRLYLCGGPRLSEGLTARLSDIDLERQTLQLMGKNRRKQEQPLPLTLLVDLVEFAFDRGATPVDDRILRGRRGRPISKKIHEQLWKNVRNELAWARAMDLSTHCLRKTGATAVERHAGTAVSEAWLRHATPTLNGIYTSATLEEVATAVADLTDEPHALATRSPKPAAASLLLPRVGAAG